MIHRLRRTGWAILAALFLASGPGSGGAAGQIQVGDATLEIGGRAQFQAAHTSADGAPALDLFARRIRMTFDVSLNEWISGRIQPDFTESVDLRDAYVRLTVGDGFRLDMGQFKRAFDLFVLTSSTEIEEVERDGRIPGLAGPGACSGVGNVCSLVRFTERLAFADRDVGFRVQGEAGSRFEYMATVTNGTGLGRGDENDAKSAAGRLVFSLGDGVRVAGNVSVHDYPSGGEDRYAAAWGGDLEVGDFRAPGVHVRVGLVGGDNWRAAPVDEPTFLSTQGIVTWYRPVGDAGPVVAVEPLARASWGDPDLDSDDDGGLLLTPGFAVYFGGRNKLTANLDVYAPGQGDAEFSLKLQSFFHF